MPIVCAPSTQPASASARPSSSSPPARSDATTIPAEGITIASRSPARAARPARPGAPRSRSSAIVTSLVDRPGRVVGSRPRARAPIRTILPSDLGAVPLDRGDARRAARARAGAASRVRPDRPGVHAAWTLGRRCFEVLRPRRPRRAPAPARSRRAAAARGSARPCPARSRPRPGRRAPRRSPRRSRARARCRPRRRAPRAASTRKNRSNTRSASSFVSPSP